MKAMKKYPKFVKCGEIVKNWSWNKYLPKPWKVGEIVKVAPEEEQHSSQYVGTPDEIFRKTYLVVYRKGYDGKFSYKCTGELNQFETLK